jgi:hypothetical protein
MTTKHIQLATSREAKASGTPGPDDIFYSSTDYNLNIPSTPTAITLCSNSDGTGDTYVDDQVKISVNGEQIFLYDYSNKNSGRIIPIGPANLLNQFKPYYGTSVVIETTYTDLYPNSNGASDFFLVIEY